MDDDTQFTRALSPTLPRAEPFESANPSLASMPNAYPEADGLAEGKMQAGVFQRLVSDDNDIAGLVAYSIYKQNKLDWLRAFETAKGRTPDEGELSAYIIGEATPRRLATYRHLAEATLAGRGPEIDAPHANPRAVARRAPVLADGRTVSPALIATYALIAILFLIGLWLALHFTVTTR